MRHPQIISAHYNATLNHKRWRKIIRISQTWEGSLPLWVPRLPLASRCWWRRRDWDPEGRTVCGSEQWQGEGHNPVSDKYDAPGQFSPCMTPLLNIFYRGKTHCMNCYTVEALGLFKAILTEFSANNLQYKMSYFAFLPLHKTAREKV